jgi:hypothetical protein
MQKCNSDSLSHRALEVRPRLCTHGALPSPSRCFFIFARFTYEWLLVVGTNMQRGVHDDARGA